MKIMVSAYLDNNIGDDMMIKLMASFFKEHKFYLYSNRTTIRNTYSGIENIIVKDLSEKNKDINETDIFLSIGGSIFNNLNTIRGKISRIRKILFILKARIKGNKVATIGCNLGPYKDNIGLLLTKLELMNSDLVTVRDKSSMEILKKLKINKNSYLADDIVYNYELEKNNSIKKYGLGISAYRSLKSNEINYINYSTLANIADDYIEKTGKKVLLFAFDSEMENDLSSAHHILNLSRRKDKIEIIPYLGDEHSFINEMSACERIIAIRFHSAILADKLNIPFLPIVYSNKMESFLNDRGYEHKIIKIDELNDSLDIDDTVNKIIDGETLFNKFLSNNGNSIIHFEELAKLLNE